ncbi:hypothetical protein [Azospirillum sp. sgz302134]
MTETKEGRGPLAGVILTVGGQRVAIVGEPLADVLDMSRWTEVENTQAVWTPEQQANADAAAAAFSEQVRRNPPKRIA